MATSNRKSAASSARKSSSSSNRSRSSSSSSRSNGSTSRRSSPRVQSNFFRRNFGAILIFVLLFGGIGVYMLVTSRAATFVELHVASNGGPCIAGASTEPCDSSVQNRIYYDITGSSGFAIKSANNLCLDDWNGAVQYKPVSSGGVRQYIHYTTCYGDANQTWHWGGADGHNLVNNASGGCLNSLGSISAGAPLGTYVCNTDANENFFKTYPSTGGTGGGTETTGQKFMDRAHKWYGEYYLEAGSAGAHSYGTYTTYKGRCESGGNPIISSSSPDCRMDCSGFVSVVVDDVLGTNYGWIVDGSGYMSGTGSSHWHSISVSNAQAGDIVTAGAHVEFVRSVSGSTVYTYGEHHSGTYVSNSQGTGYYSKAFRWE